MVEKAGVLTPEEADVLDVEEFHSPTLQAQAECPPYLISDTLAGVIHNSVVNDARAEDLEPLIVVEYLELYRWLREWEVGFDPAHLHVSEYVAGQVLQHLLEISFGDDLSLLDILGANILDPVGAHALHLMEGGVVSPVHSVLTVDVANAQERGVSLAHQGDLMDRGVGAEADLTGFVVGVRSSSANVIFGNAQFIEALLDFDKRLKVFEDAETLSGDLQVRDLCVYEEMLDLADQGVQRVPLHTVNLPLSQIQDLLRNIVIWVFLSLSRERTTLHRPICPDSTHAAPH